MQTKLLSGMHRGAWPLRVHQQGLFLLAKVKHNFVLRSRLLRKQHVLRRERLLD